MTYRPSLLSLLLCGASALALLPTNVAAQSSAIPGIVDEPVDVRLPQVPSRFRLDEEQVETGVESDDFSVAGELEEEPIAERGPVVVTPVTITFSDTTAVSRDILDILAADFIGRDLTMDDIAALKFKIRSHYFDRGHILVKVIVPPQDFGGDEPNLHFDIYEAQVGNVTVNSNGVVYDRLAQQIAGKLAQGNVFNESDAESVVNDFRDLGNVDATVNLRKGTTFGTTDVVVDVRQAERDRDRSYVSFDNYGSKLTGEYVATIHAEKSNYFGLGEKISADFRHSHEELRSGSVNVRIPTGIKNVQVETGATYSENEIGDRLEALDLEGRSVRWYAALAHQLVNRRSEKLGIKLGVEARLHKSEQASATQSHDSLRQVYAEANYFKREPNWVLSSTTRVTRGVDGLGAKDRGDPNLTNVNAAADSTRIRQSLYWNMLSPFSDGDFKAFATGQVSGSQMFSSDLFVLGGYGSVRGFDVAEQTGDSGYSFNLEYNHNLPVPETVAGYVNNWKVGPFFDGGAVYTRTSTSIIDKKLYSVGLGAEANVQLMPQRNTRIRLDAGFPVGDYDSSEVSDAIFYFRIGQDL